MCSQAHFSLASERQRTYVIAMVRRNIVTTHRRKRIVKYRGICGDAKALKVHRVTLYKMLEGLEPQLKTLRRRYDELKARQAAEGRQ